MKTSNITIRVIEPREGYYLTRKDKKEDENIILSKKVFLSALDSPDNWTEISEAEGDAIQEEEERKANESSNA